MLRINDRRSLGGVDEDDFFKDHQAAMDKVGKATGTAVKAFGFVWLLSALFSLALTGFGVWAIYRLVMHFTST